MQILLSGCVSSVCVKEARRMQDRDGFFNANLEYYGSSDDYHYFTQQQHEAWIWCVLKEKLQELQKK